MSTAIVRNVILDFIKDDRPSVLVLRGAWGVGKTHFWKSCISENPQSSRSTYSYVSMFGISTIQQLQLSVFINARSQDWWEACTTHRRDGHEQTRGG